jgi:hypothetical protein
MLIARADADDLAARLGRARGKAVLQVHGCRRPPALEPSRDTCELLGVEEALSLVERDELEAARFGRLGHDPVDIGRRQYTAVEEERHDLCEIARLRNPVHGEQVAGLDDEAYLLLDLALCGEPWRLVAFDRAAGNVPCRLVGRLKHQQSIRLVRLQTVGGDPFGGALRGEMSVVGHGASQPQVASPSRGRSFACQQRLAHRLQLRQFLA